MNYIDLFSGIGGFALGAQRAGFNWQSHFNSDIDEYSNRVYKKNFPESINLGDIKKIKTEELPNGNYILSGGFPCQDISCAGKRAGIKGEKSGLWYEYWRIIREIRPQYAIMENVGALTIRGLCDVLGSLASIGYDAEWETIRACQFGMPHHRRRLWIIAYPIGKYGRTAEPFIEKERKKLSLFNEFDCKNLRVNDKREARKTYIEESGCEPLIGRKNDGLSNRVDRLKCLGNSIVPQIAEYIFNTIKEIDENL